MSTKRSYRPRRLIARIGTLLAAALCISSLAVFAPAVSAAPQNNDIVSGKVYRIINLGSGKYLNVTGGRDQDNINVNQYTGDGTNTQDFIIRWDTDEICFKIYPICSSNGNGRVLHIARSGSSLASGGNAVIKTESSADKISQRFQIETIGHNLFYIRPAAQNSLYLTANGDDNGTWTGTGADTAGNVVAKTKLTRGNRLMRHQMWIIVEKASTPYFNARFPFADHKNGTYYTNSGVACSNHNSCLSFWGGSQSLGFAREIYARCFGGVRLSDDHTTAGACPTYSATNTAPLKNYIKTKVGYGGHVRVKQANKTQRSLIVASYDNYGIQLYDVNQSGTCNVNYSKLTYAEFAQQFPSILYCHKGHIHNYDTYRMLNHNQHVKYCTSCNFSTYDPYSLADHTFQTVSNGKKCTTCKFMMFNYEPQDTSSPEEWEAASEPEELLTPSVSEPDEPAAESPAGDSAADNDISVEPAAGEASSAAEAPVGESADSGAESSSAGDAAGGELPTEGAADSGTAPLIDPAILPEDT